MTRYDKIQLIVSCGISLHEEGISGWALTKEQVHFALDQIETESFFVLGGDVYQREGDRLRPNYDNWYCDRENGEENNAYSKRSVATARQYVTQYGARDEREVFFVLVLE